MKVFSLCRGGERILDVENEGRWERVRLKRRRALSETLKVFGQTEMDTSVVAASGGILVINFMMCVLFNSAMCQGCYGKTFPETITHVTSRCWCTRGSFLMSMVLLYVHLMPCMFMATGTLGVCTGILTLGLIWGVDRTRCEEDSLHQLLLIEGWFLAAPANLLLTHNPHLPTVFLLGLVSLLLVVVCSAGLQRNAGILELVFVSVFAGGVIVSK